ncbi:MAG: hypothetical protein IJW24_00370, partial [Clostridia bacterium]|nr:hypothetical protein [Clostridia bacterium]
MGKQNDFHDRNKQKRVNAFRRSLWIWNKNTPQDVINQKTIDFAKRGLFLRKIELDDAQCSDPEFMKKLFGANPKTFDFVKPSAGLEENIDFMVDYFKMYFEYYFQNKPHITKKLSNLPLINKYSNLMKNPEFVSKIIYVFHENNIVEAIHGAVIGDAKTSHAQTEIELHETMKNIPLWVLLIDARRFGVDALKFIPKSHPDFVKIVDAGIACDGFESLEYLPAKFIPDNIYLIKKAFHTVTPYAVSADA